MAWTPEPLFVLKLSKLALWRKLKDRALTSLKEDTTKSRQNTCDPRSIGSLSPVEFFQDRSQPLGLTFRSPIARATTVTVSPEAGDIASRPFIEREAFELDELKPNMIEKVSAPLK